MMTRLELQSELERILGSGNVYFQPPEGYKLSYPCILYEKSSVRSIYADDVTYLKHPTFTVTVIDRDPDSDIPDRLLSLRGAKFDRHFTNDNLHHNVISLTLF